MNYNLRKKSLQRGAKVLFTNRAIGADENIDYKNSGVQSSQFK